MDVVYPNEGLIYVCKRIAGNATDALNGLTWHLYTNDITPDRSSVIGDFDFADAEMGANTYDQTDLSVTGISSNVGVILRVESSFLNTSGGPVDIYGYVVTDIIASKVIAVARLDGAPFTVADATSITITPEISARSFLP